MVLLYQRMEGESKYQGARKGLPKQPPPPLYSPTGAGELPGPGQMLLGVYGSCCSGVNNPQGFPATAPEGASASFGEPGMGFLGAQSAAVDFQHQLLVSLSRLQRSGGLPASQSAGMNRSNLQLHHLLMNSIFNLH